MYGMYFSQRGPPFAGTTKFANSTANFKHKTQMNHNGSMEHKQCWDRSTDGIAGPLPAAF